MSALEKAMAHLSLVARQHSNGDSVNGKTPQQWATEGRYNYPPSFAAAIVFLVLFGIAMVVNWIQLIRHRAWFWWVMNFAIAIEFVGYLSRSISIKMLDQRNIFIVQLVFILVAPAVMAAACYMAFGRIVLWVVPPRFQTAKYLWVPARRVTPIFVGFDILSFFVQVAGGAMIAGADTPSRIARGRDVVLAGLGLQLGAFGFFVITSLRLTVLLKTQLRDVSLPKERNWQLFLTVINVANILILIRTVLRLVEYAMGNRNYLLDHEWFFYAFDSVLMLLVVVLFIICHPGHYLPYLGIRRKAQQFSQRADNGPFAKFARGPAAMELA